MTSRLLLAALALLAPPTIGAAQPGGTGGAGRCTALSGTSADGISVTKAEVIAAATTVGPNPTPEHCRISAKFEERVGAGGKPYAIEIELRVPLAWNGRMVFQGGGGLNGIIMSAMGKVNAGNAPSALQRGFAVVTTDSGHKGGNAQFAADQLAKLNYAYASIGKVGAAAKALIARLQGKVPEKSYYIGCSNGGREAMLAAQRFPDMFDGVYAGDPAFDLAPALLLANFSTQTYARMAPPGKPIPAGITAADFKLVGAAVLKQCDALDGQKDGMIFDQLACKFDPAVVQCGKAPANACLSKAKVNAIRTGFDGPRGRDGKRLFEPWVYDASVGQDAWMSWQTGMLFPNGTYSPGSIPLIQDALANYFHYPAIPLSALPTLDVQKAMTAMEPSLAITNATSTEFSTFAARGGKMLLLTGWNDPIFSAWDLVRWYRQLDRDSKATMGSDAASFARLFLVPGMLHCQGGQGLDEIDTLSALVDWVEKGRSPDSILAAGRAFPGVTRPICAFPKHAVYDGKGPPADASSYICRPSQMR